MKRRLFFADRYITVSFSPYAGALKSKKQNLDRKLK